MNWLAELKKIFKLSNIPSSWKYLYHYKITE